MKFFKPQIQLARERQLDAPSIYFMHVVTFCTRTCFKADGYTLDDTELSNGLYKVTVNLLEDSNLPDMKYITPVVHTISLGEIDFPGGEGLIEVSVTGGETEEENGTGAFRNNNPTTTTKTGGKGTVSTIESEDKTRPIRTNSFS